MFASVALSRALVGIFEEGLSQGLWIPWRKDGGKGLWPEEIHGYDAGLIGWDQ